MSGLVRGARLWGGRLAVVAAAGLALVGCSVSGAQGAGHGGALTVYGYDYGTAEMTFSAACGNNMVAGSMAFTDPSYHAFDGGPSLQVQGTNLPWKASCGTLNKNTKNETIVQTGFYHQTSDYCISQSQGQSGLDTCNGLYVLTVGRNTDSVVTSAVNVAKSLGQTVTLSPITNTGASGYAYALILFSPPIGVNIENAPLLIAVPFYQNDGPILTGHITLNP